jgi:teichuronic acid biosynthesis glycosyltransferase TuaC
LGHQARLKRTQVAHVIFPRPNQLRPVPEFTWGAVQAIADTRDFDITVFMPLPIRPLRAFSSLSRQARGADPWPEDLEAQLLRLEPRPVLVPFVPVPQRSTESAAAALAAILMRRPRGSRPKVIQGSFLDEGGYTATTVGRVLDCKSIVVAHGTDVRAARGELGQGGKRRRALSALGAADRVVAVSTRLAQDLALVGARAEILPFTAKAATFPLANPPKGPPEVLFVGRVGRPKGVDLLLEAFSLIPRKDLTLHLIGADIGDLDVAKAAAQLGILDRLKVSGELPHDELPRYYSRATLTVLPSRGEGLPSVLVESLLTGRPVVASDVGGVRELVDDRVGALVSEPGPGPLARAIAETLQRAEAGRFTTASLRAAAMPYAWESVGPRLAEMTRQLIA